MKRPRIERTELALDHIFLLDGVLTSGECRRHIEAAEARGFDMATIDAPGGPALRPGARNNDRVVFDDESLAGALWARVRPVMPEHLSGLPEWRACGLNERFRVYRYAPGQFFAPHFDGSYVRSAEERSLLSFLIYLNDDYVGGRTAFRDTEVDPRPGRALCFRHRIEHEGRAPERGQKYVLRTDVMFHRDA